jgi:acetylornithine aminotransferase/acetylornithine/N-succinyldiaminopimelate aminotransferase
MEKLLGQIRRTGDYFISQLQKLSKKHSEVTNVRGMGLMLALQLNSGDLAKAVVRELLKQGILINRTHETVLRFLPPYIVEKKHIDQLVEALDSSLQQIAADGTTASRKRASRPQASATREARSHA